MQKEKDFMSIFADRAGEFPDKAAIVDLDGMRNDAEAGAYPRRCRGCFAVFVPRGFNGRSRGYGSGYHGNVKYGDTSVCRWNACRFAEFDTD